MKMKGLFLAALTIFFVSGAIASIVNICYSVDNYKDYTSKFERDGHSYVLVHANGTNAITHDPDCPCNKNGVDEP